MKKQYQEPKAQHWIVLRLVKQSFKDHKGGHSRTTGLSTFWLIREVGILQGDHRFNPAHPTGHGFQIAPNLPHLFDGCRDLGGDRVFQPASHGCSLRRRPRCGPGSLGNP